MSAAAAACDVLEIKRERERAVATHVRQPTSMSACVDVVLYRSNAVIDRRTTAKGKQESPLSIQTRFGNRPVISLPVRNYYDGRTALFSPTGYCSNRLKRLLFVENALQSTTYVHACGRVHHYLMKRMPANACPPLMLFISSGQPT